MTDLIIYADDSKCYSDSKTEIPDMYFFGGFGISGKDEIRLRNKIEQIKEKYGASRAPIKWNFESYKNTYLKTGSTKIFNDLKEKSKQWREDIFNLLNEFDIRIITACIQAYGETREALIKTDENLKEYVFSNFLMQISKYCKSDSIRIIVDWPAGNNKIPFDTEYAHAYNFGKSTSKKVTYHSGPLKEIGFYDSLCYANSNHTTLLQVADLIIGAVRDFIEDSLGKSGHNFGTQMLSIVKEKILGYPNGTHIFQQGISISTNSIRELRDSIQKSIKSKLLNLKH